MENCPIVFDETTKQYTLRIPTRYKEETVNVAKYNHCILLSLRPAAAGAKTEILGLNGLVVGQVRSSVLLDIDALRSLGDNAGFAIRVIAPDGVTQKIHTVKIVYASSTTTPEVAVTGPNLDTAFTDNTYSYYLDYTSANADVGTMTVKLPDGSRATVNGMDYTSGAAITLDPKKDFYRLTINYTRILRQLGIGVLFEKENINSLPPDSEFMITMYGAMAQSESESISGNIRRGRQMHAKVGTLKIPCNRLYAYRKDEDISKVILPVLRSRKLAYLIKKYRFQ